MRDTRNRFISTRLGVEFFETRVSRFLCVDSTRTLLLCTDYPIIF
jgi:hypothetical protein